MNNLKKKDGPDQDLRTLLKTQHKKVYSICRFFANNYKEHQRLFANIIAAASQNIRHRREQKNKQTLILRACINMVALHSITLGLNPGIDRKIQFKSPDYQRSMVNFRESVGAASDYDKMLLFLDFEKLSHEEVLDITGSVPPPKKTTVAKENAKKNFIPYLKEKLIWS